MIDFAHRAYLPELMDEPCSYTEFRDCLQDLAQVNRLTFAYRPTLLWLDSVLRTGDNRVHIVDVGCGGGDMLRRIARWAEHRHIQVQLTGIDLNPHAARAARELGKEKFAIDWVTGSGFAFQSETTIDIVISSLLTHHLPDEEIVRFLQWMERVTTVGWFVNDLNRQRLPYTGFKALAAVMRWHRFVKHDGPVSIRRSFRHADWERSLNEAAISLEQVTLETFRPARLCVARVKR